MSLGLLVFRYPFKSENLEILIPSISFIISPILIPALLAPIYPKIILSHLKY